MKRDPWTKTDMLELQNFSYPVPNLPFFYEQESNQRDSWFDFDRLVGPSIPGRIGFLYIKGYPEKKSWTNRIRFKWEITVTCLVEQVHGCSNKSQLRISKKVIAGRACLVLIKPWLMLFYKIGFELDLLNCSLGLYESSRPEVFIV